MKAVGKQHDHGNKALPKTHELDNLTGMVPFILNCNRDPYAQYLRFLSKPSIDSSYQIS